MASVLVFTFWFSRSTGLFINFPYVGNSNLGQLPFTFRPKVGSMFTTGLVILNATLASDTSNMPPNESGNYSYLGPYIRRVLKECSVRSLS